MAVPGPRQDRRPLRQRPRREGHVVRTDERPAGVWPRPGIPEGFGRRRVSRRDRPGAVQTRLQGWRELKPDCRSQRGQRLYEEAKRLIPGGTQLLSKRPEQFAPGQWPAYFAEARGCEV